MTKAAGNHACEHFEAELNAFVDGELQALHLKRVVAHLDKCPACRSYVDQLRAFAQMHRDCSDSEALLKAIDAPGIFQNITAVLLSEKVDKLAGLFYQIGKAFILKGASERRKGIKTSPLTQPKPIDQSKRSAKTLLKETGELSRLNSDYEKVLRKANSFFRKGSRDRTDRLEIGRRFLEESLGIDAKCSESRIYLGFSYMITRNYDLARDQFRKVLAFPGVSEENRMIAFQNLGFLYVIEKRYEEAVDCFREIEKSGIIERQPKFYSILTSLAMTYAKVSDFEKSVEYFNKIVKQFPAKVVEVRKELCAMETFQNLIRTERAFRDRLQRTVPVLFAS